MSIENLKYLNYFFCTLPNKLVALLIHLSECDQLTALEIAVLVNKAFLEIDRNSFA